LKEAYAVRRTLPPSAEIQARIDQLLAGGLPAAGADEFRELAGILDGDSGEGSPGCERKLWRSSFV